MGYKLEYLSTGVNNFDAEKSTETRFNRTLQVFLFFILLFEHLFYFFFRKRTHDDYFNKKIMWNKFICINLINKYIYRWNLQEKLWKYKTYI